MIIDTALSSDIKQLLDSKGGINSTKIRWQREILQPLIDRCITRTNYLNANTTIGERIYHILHELDKSPVCTCGKTVKFGVLTTGYSKFCSSACSVTPDRIKKSKAGWLKRGHETRKKIEQTCIERYGAKSALAIPDMKEKGMLAKYGVTNASQIQGMQIRKKLTSIANYGAPYYMQLPEAKERQAATHRAKRAEAMLKTLARARKLGYAASDALMASYLAGTPVTILHSCGNALTVKLRSDKLPACHSCLGANSSSGEHLIRSMLLKYKPEDEVIYHDRSALKPYELDFYMPGLKLGIEFHGCYWHSSEIAGNIKHQEKALAARAAGIKLIQIMDESQLEYLERELAPCEIFDARKLSIDTVKPSEARIFLDEHHRQGFIPATVYLGLRLGSRLLAIMTFGKPRFEKSNAVELLRFATVGRVRGAASKLFKAYIKIYKPTSVVTFANLLWGSGRVYEHLGFIERHITKPGYLWVTPEQVYSRYQTQKNKLKKLLGEQFDPALTEAENMSSAGFHKVYDAGHISYLWKPLS